MAITIRNKKTEDLIRKIGRRTGEGPSAVIARLVKAEADKNSNPAPPSPEVVASRMREMEELRQKYRHSDDPKLSWADIEREMDSIFGDDFPPRSSAPL